MTLNFPAKIYQILENESTDIVRWHHNGLAFRIVDHVRFEREIIPKYFRHNQLSSVQRQLNLYGFKCISRGEDKGAFFHPKFRRGDWEVVRKIARYVPAKKPPFDPKIPHEMKRSENGMEDSDSQHFGANQSYYLSESNSNAPSYHQYQPSSGSMFGGMTVKPDLREHNSHVSGMDGDWNWPPTHYKSVHYQDFAQMMPSAMHPHHHSVMNNSNKNHATVAVAAVAAPLPAMRMASVSTQSTSTSTPQTNVATMSMNTAPIQTSQSILTSRLGFVPYHGSSSASAPLIKPKINVAPETSVVTIDPYADLFDDFAVSFFDSAHDPNLTDDILFSPSNNAVKSNVTEMMESQNDAQSTVSTMSTTSNAKVTYCDIGVNTILSQSISLDDLFKLCKPLE